MSEDKLDLNDKFTYELFHIFGAVANPCYSAGELGYEFPDFDQEVSEAKALILEHYIPRSELTKLNKRLNEECEKKLKAYKADVEAAIDSELEANLDAGYYWGADKLRVLIRKKLGLK